MLRVAPVSAPLPHLPPDPALRPCPAQVASPCHFVYWECSPLHAPVGCSPYCEHQEGTAMVLILGVAPAPSLHPACALITTVSVHGAPGSPEPPVTTALYPPAGRVQGGFLQVFAQLPHTQRPHAQHSCGDSPHQLSGLLPAEALGFFSSFCCSLTQGGQARAPGCQHSLYLA